MMMAHEFRLLRRILKDRSGVDLSGHTVDLVMAKLKPVLSRSNFASISHLIVALTKPENDALRQRAAQAMAVHESYFFRDRATFDYFGSHMLPGLLEARAASRRLRIWCAACSTGQEPYSLAMLLAEWEARLAGWDIEILATDFSEDALAKARTGRYTQFEVQRGLPFLDLVAYFQKSGAHWSLKPDVKNRVKFQAHNLLHDCEHLGQFDVILCRNAMIYFDRDLRAQVLARLGRQLRTDGYLILGAAESVTGYSNDFESVPGAPRGVYRPVARPGAACVDPVPAEAALPSETSRLALLGPDARGSVER